MCTFFYVQAHFEEGMTWKPGGTVAKGKGFERRHGILVWDRVYISYDIVFTLENVLASSICRISYTWNVT